MGPAGLNIEILAGMWNRRIHYRIQDLLGEGSQGRVFKALRHDPSSGLKQTVAAKILHSRTAVDLWRREFESLTRVRSPYCVQVYAFERIKGRPALILEFVDGLSLTTLHRLSYFSTEELNEVLAQLETGILDLYKTGLFHGDLSPHNILVDVEGRVRILDFGTANFTRSSSRLTPEFASPERLCGHGADLASDIFSLGRIEQFLKGEPPSGTSSSVYLLPEPHRRSLRGLIPSPQQQIRIGEKVRLVQSKQREARRLRTQTWIQKEAPGPVGLLPFVRLAVVILILAFCPGSQSAKLSPPASLIVRTQNWLKLTINGKDSGYSPQILVFEDGQTLRIEWTTASAKGLLKLKMTGGKTLQLTDRDFSH